MLPRFPLALWLLRTSRSLPLVSRAGLRRPFANRRRHTQGWSVGRGLNCRCNPQCCPPPPPSHRPQETAHRHPRHGTPTLEGGGGGCWVIIAVDCLVRLAADCAGVRVLGVVPRVLLSIPVGGGV